MQSEQSLIPCKIATGFFEVPGKPFSVNRDGWVFSHKLNRFYIPKKGDRCEITNSYRNVVRENAHVLVAETFLTKPKDAGVKYTVNHKNGLKYDNHVDNLEWITYSDNIKHAYETGLRKDNRRVKIMNTLTGEIIQFVSIQQCARFLKVNGGNVYRYLNRSRLGYFFEGVYLLVYADSEFPSPEQYKSWMTSNQPNAWLVHDKSNNKSVIYSGVRNVCDYVRCNTKTFTKLLDEVSRDNRYDIEHNGFVILPLEYARDYVESGVEDRRYNRLNDPNYKPPRRLKKPCILVDTRTGTSTTYPDIYQAASSLGIRHETLKRQMKVNNDIVKDFYKVIY